ncbi:MAG: hypothetical protein ACC660_04205 [Acidimicrobiales bacterium]
MPETPEEPDDEVTEWLMDLLYTGVGLAVLGVNRLQVARRSAQKHFATPASTGDEPDTGTETRSLPTGALSAIAGLVSDPEQARSLLRRLRQELQDIDDRLGGIDNRLTDMLRDLEPDLPDGAREISAALRGLTYDHATQLRAVLGLRVR